MPSTVSEEARNAEKPMSRREYYARLLPLLEDIWDADRARYISDSSQRLVGPTLAELKAFAPSIAAAVQDGREETDPSFLLQCSGELSFSRLNEFLQQSRRDRYYPRPLIALAPGTALSREGLNCFDDTIASAAIEAGASPGLALLIPSMHRFYGAGAAWVVAPTSELCSPLVEELAHRVNKSDNMLARVERRTYVDQVRHALRAGARWDWYDSASGMELGFRELRRIFEHRDYLALTPYRDKAIWPAPHWRVFRCQDLADPAERAALVAHALAMISGEGERSEDDRFPMGSELLGSRTWSTDEDLAVEALAERQSSRGYPTRRLSEVCQIMLFANREGALSAPASAAFIALDGSSAGEVVERVPNSAGGGFSLQRLVSSHRVETDRSLGQCDSSRFAVLESTRMQHIKRCIMEKPIVQEWLRSRSMGSLRRFRIPDHLVRDLPIPWPSDEQMGDIALQRAAWNRAAESLEELGSELNYLSNDFLNRAGDEPSRDIDYFGSPLLDGDELVRIKQVTLEVAAIAKGLGVDVAGSQVPRPAVFAHLERSFRNTTEAHYRLRLALDRAEVALRIDAAVVASCLAKIDTAGLGSLCAKMRKEVKRRILRFTVGHWKQLRQEARAALVKSLEHGNSQGGLAEEVARVSSDGTGRFAEQIVENRNRHAHGSTPTPDGAASWAEDVFRLGSDLITSCPYLCEVLHYQIAEVRLQQKGTLLRRLMLVHEHPVFELQEVPLSGKRAAGPLSVGEVYVETAVGERLSLYPWVIVETPHETGHPTIYLLDSILESGDGEYYAPLVPQAKKRRVEVVRDVLSQLFGGR